MKTWSLLVLLVGCGGATSGSADSGAAEELPVLVSAHAVRCVRSEQHDVDCTTWLSTHPDRFIKTRPEAWSCPVGDAGIWRDLPARECADPIGLPGVDFCCASP